MNTKLWWQSRTIWLQIVAAVFAILATFQIALPAWLDQGQIVSAIMLVVAIVSAILRLNTSTAIAPSASPLTDAAAGQASGSGPDA
jgi:protein-S-isoprenylcysteine O-methyltransferase Ste14